MQTPKLKEQLAKVNDARTAYNAASDVANDSTSEDLDQLEAGAAAILASRFGTRPEIG